MAMLYTNFDNTAVSLTKNLTILVGAAFNTHVNEWPAIVGTPIPTSMRVNKEMAYEGPGAASEQAENANTSESELREGYADTVSLNLYALAIPITLHLRTFAVQNAQLLKQISMFLARSMKLRHEYTAIAVIDNAVTAGVTGGDGQVYASASHTYKDGNTYSNLLTAADLSKTQLETAIKTLVGTMTIDAGIPGEFTPKMLGVAYTNIFKIKELLKSSQDPESGNNTYNGFIDYNLKPNLNHYQSDDDQWYMDSEYQTRFMYRALKPTMDTYMDNQKQNFVGRMSTMIGAGFMRPAGTLVNMGA